MAQSQLDGAAEGQGLGGRALAQHCTAEKDRSQGAHTSHQRFHGIT
jgi:hypothetical protein